MVLLYEGVFIIPYSYAVAATINMHLEAGKFTCSITGWFA
jgi:hypothetical protein